MKIIAFILNIIMSILGIFVKIYYRDYVVIGNIFLVIGVISFYYLLYSIIFKRHIVK